ncbi:MAG: hypothetical protein AAGU17_06310 [Anaerolineaceae bacterium]|jgi:hypothetical protein
MSSNALSIKSEVGILYIATGAKYIKAAMRSAESVQKFCPGLPIHLFANYREYDLKLDQAPNPFSSVAEVTNPHRRSKVDYLSATPFDRTLYLDTDTIVNADIRQVFKILDRFDLALCHAPHRNSTVSTSNWRTDIPDAFPEFNSGVFLYKKTSSMLKLLEDWKTGFYEAGFQKDQVTLRELLWLSDLRIATLPPEYNIRYMKYHYIWSRKEATSKIFHLRRLHYGRFSSVTRIWKKYFNPIYYSIIKKGQE